MKRNLIVICEASTDHDLQFFEVLLDQKTFLSSKAVVINFPTVQQFADFIESMGPEYEFSLLIHMGKFQYNEPRKVEPFINELSKLPYYEKLKFEWTTRSGDDKFQGRIVRHTFKLGNANYDINSLPLNTVGELKGLPTNQHSSKPQSKKLEKPKPIKNELHFETAILTALYKDEHEVFQDNMHTNEIKGKSNLTTGTFRDMKSFESNVTHLLAWQDMMGSIDAAAFSSMIITEYDPKFLILGGVCGGRQDDTSLYDIIIPDTVHDYISGKLEDGEFKPVPIPASINKKLFSYLKNHEEDILNNMRKLAPTQYKNIMKAGFRIHFKSMACGPWVIKTDHVLDEMAKKVNENIKGLEMESLGVVRAAELFQMYGKYGLVVKSVMDHTTIKKTDGPAGSIKTTAAYMSYLCIRAILPLLKKFKDPKMKSTN